MILKISKDCKSDHTFDDWYADADFTTPYNFESKVFKNTKIYALFYTNLDKVLEIGAGVASGTISEKEYFVTGVVKSIAQAVYGNLTITDGTTDLFIYGVFSKDGSVLYNELPEIPLTGDTIYVKGPIKNFNDYLD